jgi:hypothetical protein
VPGVRWQFLLFTPAWARTCAGGPMSLLLWCVALHLGHISCSRQSGLRWVTLRLGSFYCSHQFRPRQVVLRLGHFSCSHQLEPSKRCCVLGMFTIRISLVRNSCLSVCACESGDKGLGLGHLVVVMNVVGAFILPL